MQKKKSIKVWLPKIFFQIYRFNVESLPLQTLNDMTRSMTAPLVHIKKLAKASNVKVGYHIEQRPQICSY